jgi:hypothetical protein
MGAAIRAEITPQDGRFCVQLLTWSAQNKEWVPQGKPEIICDACQARRLANAAVQSYLAGA